jgi:GT2 family glycosyltransferase
LETFGLGDEMRVVVVDNDSRDGSVEMVRDGFAWVRLVALDRNVGYAEGNNIGIAAGLGFQPSQAWEGDDADSIVLTLNPDVEFFDDSLRTAVEEIRSRPDVGAMGIRLVFRVFLGSTGCMGSIIRRAGRWSSRWARSCCTG